MRSREIGGMAGMRNKMKRGIGGIIEGLRGIKGMRQIRVIGEMGGIGEMGRIREL